MSPEPDPFDRLVVGLRAGEAWAIKEFCDRFGEPLERIADRKLPAGLRRRLGPEDVVQSACCTFFRRVRLGEFNLPDAASLWHLLCAITLNKVTEKARFHLRQKRSLGREEDVNPATGESGVGFDPASSTPQPDEAAEFADQLRVSVTLVGRRLCQAAVDRRQKSVH